MDGAVRVLVVGVGDGEIPALKADAARRPRLSIHGPVAARTAGAAANDCDPDVVYVRVDGREVAGVLAALRATSRRVRILVEADPDVPGLIGAVLAAGGCGVLPTGADAATRREAILRANAGELVLEEDDLRDVVNELATSRARLATASIASLTSREREIMGAFAEGLTTIEVAGVLGISSMTVQSHVKNVMAKLGVHSKVEAVRAAWRGGLIPVPS